MTPPVYTVVNVSRISIGLIFVASAIAKLKDRNAFQTVVFLLGGPFRAIYKELSILILGLEILSSLCLCFGILPLATTFLSFSLILLFDGVLIALRIGHPGVDCGCFGSRGGGITLWHLIRNAVMTGASAVLLILTLNFPHAWQRPSLVQLAMSGGFAIAAIGISTYKSNS